MSPQDERRALWASDLILFSSGLLVQLARDRDEDLSQNPGSVSVSDLWLSCVRCRVPRAT